MHMITNSFLNLCTGNQRYGPLDFSGTIFVNTDEGLNYIGFVFGYQSNTKFYSVMWRHKNLNLNQNTYKAGIKGLQLKVGLVALNVMS